MASRLSRRAATLALKHGVDQVQTEACSAITVARELVLARSVLAAEIEANSLLSRLAADGFSKADGSNHELLRKSVTDDAPGRGSNIQTWRERVAGLELRAAASGLTEDDIRTLARC